MQIRRLAAKDLSTVASQHLDYLPTPFIRNKYSLNLLASFYGTLGDMKDNIALVAEDNGEVIGYICMIRSLENLYISFFKKCPLKIFGSMLMLAFQHPVTSIMEVLTRLQTLAKKGTGTSTKGNQDLTEAVFERYELRPIVVRKDYHGSQVAERLVSRAEEILQFMGIDRYFLRVNISNNRAVGFYRKMGLTPVGYQGNDILLMEQIMQ